MLLTTGSSHPMHSRKLEIIPWPPMLSRDTTAVGGRAPHLTAQVLLQILSAYENRDWVLPKDKPKPCTTQAPQEGSTKGVTSQAGESLCECLPGSSVSSRAHGGQG